MDKNKQAILLLCARFSTTEKGAPTPLTALEYGRFASWLKDSQLQPKDLFDKDIIDKCLQQWQDPKGKITADRLQYLMGRGLAMGLAVDKWHSAGIWILPRSDKDYPERLKKKLGHAAPALLFGVGNQKLLNTGGLAVVGSRNIGKSDTTYTQKIAQQAALEGLTIVSGGARGVDETSMLAALEADGNALGVLANDLFKSAVAGKWRKYLKNGQLVLVSTIYPEARFQVGNAMARNKYIYTLADNALVVRSEKDTGGTWAGAKENLKNTWTPLFVASPSSAEGNEALVSKGAKQVEVINEGDTATNWLTAQLDGKPVEQKKAASG